MGIKLGLMAYICNLSTQKIGIGGLPRVQVHLGYIARPSKRREGKEKEIEKGESKPRAGIVVCPRKATPTFLF